MARRKSDEGIVIALLLAAFYLIYLVFQGIWKLFIYVRDLWKEIKEVNDTAQVAEKEPTLESTGLIQNERFRNILRKIIDTADMKLPLDQSTIEELCNELKQEGLELNPGKLQKELEVGLVRYVIQEFVRVEISDIVWPEGYGITDRGLDGLYMLLEQKGVIISKPNLQQMVNTEILRQERERFKDSFFRFKPDLRDEKDEKRLVEGYVDIFGESYQGQLRYFEWFIEESTKRSFSQMDLVGLIQAEIKRRADLRMAESIRSAIQTGRVHKNRIQIEDIDQMDGFQFEHFLQKLFSAMGYKVEVTKASGDQGADLLAEKFGSKFAIQAKRYSGPVGNKAVQEVIGAMQYYKCDKGIVVTNSTFTKSATELAQSSNVELIDRNRLIELLDKYEMRIEVPKPTPVTDAEHAYLNQIRENSEQIIDDWKQLNDLFSNANLLDDNWKKECATLLSDIKMHVEDAYKMIPPKVFEDAHETYLKSMNLFDYAVQQLPDLIDALDVDGINSLQEPINQGIQYLSQALSEMGDLIDKLTTAV